MRYVALLTSLFVANQAYGDDYFPTCDVALKKSEYSKLKSYTESKNIAPQLCQRLNNGEFLYTAGEGYMIRFHHCTASKENGLECKEDSYSHYPNLAIEKRFSGKNGKKFVLFKALQLSHGVYGEGFSIFHLVSKSDKSTGYALYELRGAGEANGLNSDAGTVCSNMGESDAITSGSPSYEILDKDDQLIIRFNQNIVSCDGNDAFASQVLEYIWQKNRFRLLNDARKYR